MSLIALVPRGSVDTMIVGFTEMTTRHSTGHPGELDRRAPRIIFRLPSPELRRQLEDVARARNTTISGYVRSLVLEALRKEKDLSDYDEPTAFFG